MIDLVQTSTTSWSTLSVGPRTYQGSAWSLVHRALGELEGWQADVAETLRDTLAKADSTLAFLEERKGALTESLESAQAAVEAIEAGDDPSIATGLQIGGATAQSLGPVIPQPWGAIVAAVGTVIGTVGSWLATRERSKRKKAEDNEADAILEADDIDQALDSTIKAINAAKQANGKVVDFNDDTRMNRGHFASTTVDPTRINILFLITCL